jgi:hypothetical protein
MCTVCGTGTIVLISMIEMLSDVIARASDDVNVSFLRILRTLRMLRVLRMLRLMRKWKGLYRIVSTFINAIPQMANIVILIVLTMFMFSLLGMQVRRSSLPPATCHLPSPTYPRLPSLNDHDLAPRHAALWRHLCP